MPTTLDMQALWMALQPIVDLDEGRIVGHEALLRGPSGGPWATPAAIFQAGEETGCAGELEVLCRRLALHAGGRLRAEERIFVNLDVRRHDLPFEAEAAGLPADRVVIEISEERDVVDHPLVLAAVQRWRQEGFGIALDDYGAGRSNLSTLLAVQPDVIKMDRAITAGVARDPRHRLAVEALVRLAEDLRIVVVGEGIETQEQLHILRDLGVQLGQGFLLGHPARDPLGTRIVRLASPSRPHPRAARSPAHATAVGGFDEAFFESAPLGAYYVDKRRTILRWNAAAEAITGHPAADVVGRRCMSRILDHTAMDGTPLCWGSCPLVHAMAAGKPLRDTVLLRRSDGERVAVTVHAVPVHGEDGKIMGAVEYFQLAGHDMGGPSGERT